MDTRLYRTLLEECSPYLHGGICLNAQGEPLLDPEFSHKVQIAQELDISISALFTNGARLAQYAELLVQSRIVRSIMVSVDGATPEVHAAYRIGSDLEEVRHGIAAVAEARSKLRGRNAHLPRIRVQTVVLKTNLHQMDDIRAMAMELGADEHNQKPCWFPSVFEGERTISSELVHNWLPGDPRMWAFPSKQAADGAWVIAIPESSRFAGCPWQYQRAYINWNGGVFCCDCDQHFSHLCMGQLTYPNITMADIWNGHAYRAQRRRVNESVADHAFCRSCPRYGGSIAFLARERLG